MKSEAVLLSTDTVIIGAGPYGLALSAHLEDAGIEHRILGDPMATWRRHMPTGMMLKSAQDASSFSAPQNGRSLRDFCVQGNESYDSRVVPLPLERFLRYGDWFAQRLTNEIEQTQVVALRKTSDGFSLVTADGERSTARRVVIATGIRPFAHTPRELSTLPAEIGSHTSDPVDLAQFRDAEVLVVGAGQSALEHAALLSEAGAQVNVLVRQPSVLWNDPAVPPPAHLIGRMTQPRAALCDGWSCWGYSNLPGVFHLLPRTTRQQKAWAFLGPAGAAWLRPRVEGVVNIETSRRVVAAEAWKGRAKVRIAGDGDEASREFDHVFAATGYRVDLDRLGFIDPSLQRSVTTFGGSPVLSRELESSVPGLFFVGSMAAFSMGPVMRFVAGTGHAASRVTRRLIRTGNQQVGFGTASNPRNQDDAEVIAV